MKSLWSKLFGCRHRYDVWALACVVGAGYDSGKVRIRCEKCGEYVSGDQVAT